MAKYSKQVNDSVSKSLTDYNVKEVDMEVESYITNELIVSVGATIPKPWTKKEFRPTARFEHAYWVMKVICPEVDNWNILGTEKGQIFEAYVGDKKYSVHAPTPPRALLLAVWNYVNLKDEPEDKIEPKTKKES